jgi:hypothetical protein
VGSTGDAQPVATQRIPCQATFGVCLIGTSGAPVRAETLSVMGHLLVLVMPDVGGPIGVRLEHSDCPARNVNRRHEQGVVGAQGYTDPRMVDNSGRFSASPEVIPVLLVLQRSPPGGTAQLVPFAWAATWLAVTSSTWSMIRRQRSSTPSGVGAARSGRWT